MSAYDRYRVTVLPGTTDTYVIYDEHLKGVCSLQHEQYPEHRVPLTWRRRLFAEAWLWKCSELWGKWESDGTGVAPKDWRRNAAV